jgi:hypothetical protein
MSDSARRSRPISRDADSAASALGLVSAPRLAPRPQVAHDRGQHQGAGHDPDPHSAISWTNIQLGMQLFDRLVEAWPERTIVPSLADLIVGDRARH